MPIIILSAHSHRVIYDNKEFACEGDNNCYSFEAGCYMEAM